MAFSNKDVPAGMVLEKVLSGQHAKAVVNARFVDRGGNIGDSAVFTVGEDNLLLVWLLRDNGQFWPSIQKQLSGGATELKYVADGNLLFVGMNNGMLTMYKIAEDWNTMSATRTFRAHNGRFAGLDVDNNLGLVISAGRDKEVLLHSAETGEQVASHSLPHPAYVLVYAPLVTSLFIGDGGGCIHVLKIQQGTKTFKEIAKLEGHAGAVAALHWEQSTEYLFSGGADKMVVAWDIGNCKGERFELRGHKGKIRMLQYYKASKSLLSSDESTIVVWDMNGTRKPNPVWKQSDVCQICAQPFFWNTGKMIEEKSVAMNRQHHCRACGKAICGDCSPNRTLLTTLGHETPVRICEGCNRSVAEEDLKRRAKLIDCKWGVRRLQWIFGAQLMALTCESGDAVKLWNMQAAIDGKGVTLQEYHKATSAATKAENALQEMGSKFMSLFGIGENPKKQSSAAKSSSAQSVVPANKSQKQATTTYSVGDDNEGDPDSRAKIADVLASNDDDVSSPFT